METASSSPEQLKEQASKIDFKAAIEQVKNNKQLVNNFIDAVENSTYSGRHAHAVAVGLVFLREMLSRMQLDIDHLKSLEKQEDKANA